MTGTDREMWVRRDQPRQSGAARGLPWWAAVVLAFGLAMAGGALSLQLTHTMGLLFDVAYALGCLGAVSLVRPHALFGPMAQPPLVFLIAVTTVMLVSGTPQGGGSATTLAIGAPLLANFPAMAVTTALVLVLGAVRLLRRRTHRMVPATSV